MKKLTRNTNFLVATLCVAMLFGLAAQADAQPRKKFSRIGRPASLDMHLDTIVSDPGFGRRVVALLLPAVQNGVVAKASGTTHTVGSADPALIVFDVKNPNVRRIFPLTNQLFGDGSVRFIGFANVAKDTEGNSDDKEAILEVAKDETITIGVVSHKTGLVMAFQDHLLLGLRNYDKSVDGFLDMLLHNRAEGKMELWGN